MIKKFLTNKNVAIAMVVFTVIFAISRLIFLDADPTVFKRIHDIGDEGYWVHEARSAVLFGKWVMDEHVMAIASAPLSSLISFINFSIFGVSIFTTRLTMAIAGILSILLIYLIGSRYDKKLGLISAFILSIAEIFFMYNRIGHMEPLVILCLLTMFYFISNKTSNKRTIFYFLGGVALGLAFLAKVTTVYYILIIGLYLLASLYRKEIKIKDIVIFGFGGALVSVPWILFFFIPNRESYLHVLSALSEANYKGRLILFSHPYLLFTGIYFSYISVFLMSILSLYYMKKRKIFNLFNNLKENLPKLNEIELIALSWLFGGLFGVLLTDMVSRRYTLLVIPLVLLSSLFIYKDINITEFKVSKKLSFTSLLLISLTILNAVYYPIIAISGITQVQKIFIKIFGDMLEYSDMIITSHMLFISGIIGTLLLSGLAAFYIKRKDNRITELLNKYLPIIGGISIFLALSVTFFYSNFIYLRRMLPNNVALVILAFILGLVVINGIGFFIKKVSYITFGVFTAFCVSNIIFNIVFPQFSIKEASVELDNMTEAEEWIIGPLGHQLALEDKLKPLYYVPNEVGFKDINPNAVEEYKPRYFIQLSETSTFDPSELGWPIREELGYETKYLGSVDMFEYGFGAKYIYEIYEIDYTKPTD